MMMGGGAVPNLKRTATAGDVSNGRRCKKTRRDYFEPPLSSSASTADSVGPLIEGEAREVAERDSERWPSS
jgi:hypothetical protein